VAAHALGLATLAVALLSPLDALSAALFSAHMLQHLMLMALAAPLLTLGAPRRVYLWGAPAWLRRALGRLLSLRWLRETTALLGAPLMAIGLHTLAVWAWHAPGPYEAALRSEAIHALEHAAFLGTALWVWHHVARALPQGSGAYGSQHGAALCLLFASMVQSSLLGMLITIAPAAWYPEHGASAVAWGMTPLEDQQLAGLWMWIPGGVPHVIAALAVFYAWLCASEKAGSARARSKRNAAPAACLILAAAAMLAAAGCNALRDTPPIRQVPGGDAAAGRRALELYGCGACHVVPGIRRAVGRSAPPLTDFADRGFVAGVLSNNPDNLIRWIVDPRGVNPGTAMPDLGVTEADARNMAAYLYTLRGD
jgi:putative membrane protein